MPDPLTITGVANDQSCITSVAEGSDGFAAGLVSADDAAGDIADGAPIVTLGDPVYYAPIGIAYDRAGPDFPRGWRRSCRVRSRHCCRTAPSPPEA